MAVRPSSKSSVGSAIPALIPQGQHAGKPSLPLGRVFTLVGSRHRAHLHLLSRTVSKSHAIVINNNGQLYIRDTASREGVFVNDHLVKEAELKNGDLIRIGSFTFHLSEPQRKSGQHAATAATGGAVEREDGSAPFTLEGRTAVIGRRAGCEIVLDGIAVSNVHAVIFEIDGRHQIRDLGSRTGTFVNGEQIHQRPLDFNDRIRIGDTELLFVPSGIESTLDELEHLIGTATLGDESASLAEDDAARLAEQSEPLPTARRAVLESSDEDGPIPLDEPDEVGEPVKRDTAAKAPPRFPAAPMPVNGDLAEIDLDSDPDLSGLGDTRAISPERSMDRPGAPSLSSQVVDNTDEIDMDAEERQMLISSDLQHEKPGGSESFADINYDDEESADTITPDPFDLNLLPMSLEVEKEGVSDHAERSLDIQAGSVVPPHFGGGLSAGDAEGALGLPPFSEASAVPEITDTPFLDDDSEFISSTYPTVDSAQHMDSLLDLSPVEFPADPLHPDERLSDHHLHEAMHDFAGLSGSLVEHHLEVPPNSISANVDTIHPPDELREETGDIAQSDDELALTSHAATQTEVDLNPANAQPANDSVVAEADTTSPHSVVSDESAIKSVVPNDTSIADEHAEPIFEHDLAGQPGNSHEPGDTVVDTALAFLAHEGLAPASDEPLVPLEVDRDSAQPAVPVELDSSPDQVEPAITSPIATQEQPNADELISSGMLSHNEPHGEDGWPDEDEERAERAMLMGSALPEATAQAEPDYGLIFEDEIPEDGLASATANAPAEQVMDEWAFENASTEETHAVDSLPEIAPVIAAEVPDEPITHDGESSTSHGSSPDTEITAFAGVTDLPDVATETEIAPASEAAFPDSARDETAFTVAEDVAVAPESDSHEPLDVEPTIPGADADVASEELIALEPDIEGLSPDADVFGSDMEAEAPATSTEEAENIETPAIDEALAFDELEPLPSDVSDLSPLVLDDNAFEGLEGSEVSEPVAVDIPGIASQVPPPIVADEALPDAPVIVAREVHAQTPAQSAAADDLPATVPVPRAIAYRPDPLFGMSRDFGSFLGGAPLPFPVAPRLTPNTPGSTPTPAAKPASAPATGPQPAPSAARSNLVTLTPMSAGPLSGMTRPNSPTPVPQPVRAGPIAPAKQAPVSPFADTLLMLRSNQPPSRPAAAIKVLQGPGPTAAAAAPGMEVVKLPSLPPGMVVPPAGMMQLATPVVAAAPLAVMPPPPVVPAALAVLAPRTIPLPRPASQQAQIQPEPQTLSEQLLNVDPQTLDQLSDKMERLKDVEDVVQENIASPAAVEVVPPTVRQTRHSATDKDHRSNTVTRGTDKGSNSDLAPTHEALVKPRRTTPPPPARTTGRRVPRGPGAVNGLTDIGGPMLPPVDVFSQLPVDEQAGFGDSIEIPPTGFIPPGAGMARRQRTAITRSPVTPKASEPAPAAARTPLATRRPAVAEPLELPVDNSHELMEESNVEDVRQALIPMAEEGKKAKKRWRFPFFGMSLLIATVGGVAAAAWFGMPHGFKVQAAMRFDGLGSLKEGDRRNFERDQMRTMSQDDFRKRAQEVYQNDLHGNPNEGLLYPGSPTDAAAFAAVVDSIRSDGDKLTFERKKSSDGEADALSFRAMLRALYAVDEPMGDQARITRSDAEAVRGQLADITKRIGDLNVPMVQSQHQQADFEIARLKAKDIIDHLAILDKTWNDATASVQKFQSDLDVLLAASLRASASPNDDAQVKNMLGQLQQLNASLKAAQAARGANGLDATNGLADALTQFQKEVDAAKVSAARDGSALSSYLAVATQAASALHQANAELADRQKVNQQTLVDAKRQLAEKIDGYRKRAWANDPQLATLAQDLAVQQHRLGAASGAGLNDDAAKIRTQIDELTVAIDARRTQLAVGDHYGEDIKSVQKVVASQIDQMRGDRTRNDQKMAEQFALLDAALPKPDVLTADQRQLLDRLGTKLTALNTARQQVSQLSIPGTTAIDVASLETQITDLQAQLDARQKQSADASQTPSANESAVMAARLSLEGAQQAEARALADRMASKKELATAQAQLDQLQSASANLSRLNKEYATLQGQREDLKRHLDQLAATIVLIPQDPQQDDSVQMTPLASYRSYALAADGIFFAFTAGWLISRWRRHAEFPFAKTLPASPSSQTLGPIPHTAAAA